MYKLKKISKKIFDNYTKKIENSHFMQTTSWGEYDKVTKYTNPNYLGLVDENNKILGVALAIEEYIVGKYTCLKIPYGPILDYNDKEILKIFINQIKDYAKYKNSYIIKFNPYIEKKYNLETVLKKFNIKTNNQHKHINYQIDIQNNRESQKNIDKLLEEYDFYSIEITANPTIEKVTDMIDEDHKMLFEIFREEDNFPISLFTITLHITKTIKNIEKKITKLNNQLSIIPIDHLDEELKLKLKTLKDKKNRLECELSKFKQYKLDYGTTYIINTNLMMEHKLEAWPIMNITDNMDNEILEFFIYYEYINYFKSKDFKYLYLLNPLLEATEITQYQKLFEPELIEYEQDYYIITNKLINFIAQIKNK